MLKPAPHNPSAALGGGKGRRASLWGVLVALGLLCVMAGALLSVCQVPAAYAAVGDYVSAQDFNLTSDNGNPSRIGWDGTYHRVVDNADGKVYSYDSSGTYVSTADFDLDAANDLPSGITWDGTYHRVVDFTDGKVYSYNSAGTYVSSADFNLDSANAAAIGIAWDGTYYRVVDSGDDKVFSYNSSGTYVSAQDFNLNSDNSNINGMTWDGGHYRVLDRTDGKVYSYNSAGSHVSSADFNLDSAHSSAMGIGWDDTYIRVADSGTDKVYTYEGPGDADPVASDALSSLTQSGLDHESAAYTVTVDTTLAATVYYQVRTSGGSWPDSASSVTSSATTTLEFTGLSADTDYEIRAGIDDDFSQGELTATFTTLWYVERLLFGAKGRRPIRAGPDHRRRRLRAVERDQHGRRHVGHDPVRRRPLRADPGDHPRGGPPDHRPRHLDHEHRVAGRAGGRRI